MANTFLAAQGHNVGTSLCEHDLAGTAREILLQADQAGCEIILPTDVVVAQEFAANSPNQIVAADAVPDDMMILDAGPQTVEMVNQRIGTSATATWRTRKGDLFSKST